jgi:hypothetical protein
MPAPPPADWVDPDSPYREAFAVDPAKFPAALDAMPVLIRIPQGDLAAARADGADVWFVDDAGVTSFELDAWDEYRESTFWVTVQRDHPTVWAYWGDPRITQSQGDPYATFGGVLGVWHLQGCGARCANSATPVADLLVDSVGAAQGFSGDGLALGSERSSIQLESPVPTPFLVSAWLSDASWKNQVLVSTDQWTVAGTGAGVQVVTSDGTSDLPAATGAPGPHLLVVSWHLDGSLAVFLDDVALAAPSVSATFEPTRVWFGGLGGGAPSPTTALPYAGVIDEIGLVRPSVVTDRQLVDAAWLNGTDWVQAGGVETLDGTPPPTGTTTTTGTLTTETTTTGSTSPTGPADDPVVVGVAGGSCGSGRATMLLGLLPWLGRRPAGRPRDRR